VGSHDRQQLERRLHLALVAGLPLLEKEWRSTPELRADQAAEWARRGWPASIESETPIPADVLDRLWRIAERLGISTHEAVVEAQALGYREALSRA
jgi:hypothetical protein